MIDADLLRIELACELFPEIERLQVHLAEFRLDHLGNRVLLCQLFYLREEMGEVTDNKDIDCLHIPDRA